MDYLALLAAKGCEIKIVPVEVVQHSDGGIYVRAVEVTARMYNRVIGKPVEMCVRIEGGRMEKLGEVFEFVFNKFNEKV